MMNFYQILGVSFDATQEEIKHAYRILVKKYHPDVNPNGNVSEKIVNVNLAYETLSNPEKRKTYDMNFKINTSKFNKSNKSSNTEKNKEIDYQEWLKIYLVRRQPLDKLYSKFIKKAHYPNIFNLNEIKILIGKELILLINKEIHQPVNILNFIFDKFKIIFSKVMASYGSISFDDDITMLLLLAELDMTLKLIFDKFNPNDVEYIKVIKYIFDKYINICGLYIYLEHLDLDVILRHSRLKDYINEFETTLLNTLRNNLSYYDDFDDFSRSGR